MSVLDYTGICLASTVIVFLIRFMFADIGDDAEKLLGEVFVDAFFVTLILAAWNQFSPVG